MSLRKQIIASAAFLLFFKSDIFHQKCGSIAAELSSASGIAFVCKNSGMLAITLGGASKVSETYGCQGESVSFLCCQGNLPTTVDLSCNSE